MPKAPEDDSNHEWIELNNTSDSPIDLTGYTIETAVTGSYPSFSESLSSVMLGANSYYVIAGSSVSGDVDQTMSNTSILGNADGVRLKYGAIVIDTVIYGATNGYNFLDDNGTIATSLAPMSGDDLSIARSLMVQIQIFPVMIIWFFLLQLWDFQI